ncbi:MAG: histidine kinase [Burkholderiales bacterium]|nr:histidine kinase [Burkholderiales bacterium]
MIGVDVAGAIGSRSTDGLVRSLLMFALVSIVFNLYFGARARQSEAEQQASEAQLRLLQGQIEPHFLFNTLANVIALIDHDAPRAKAMLESFTDYLRASLTGLRAGDATLGSEIDLARAYLELLALRMEDRLRYEIDCDAALRDAALPSLLLQPLVENAIHHGLEPKVDGGTVRVTARREGRLLVVAVTDDGLGLAAPPRRKAGAGLALANLRERLHARYGREATLTLAAAAPGTVATLRLPIEQASAR